MKHLLILIAAIFVSANMQAQENQPENLLKGKQVGVLGDSYVRNHKEAIELTWHYKFAQKYGMVYHNFGRNGNAVAIPRERFGEAMYIRYAEMPDSLDYILVIAGHNDSEILDEIGGIDIFREKMSVLCEGLIDKYPSAKIFFFTRWICDDFEGSDAEKVTDAMIEVCGKYSIPIFDSARKGGIYATSEKFRKLYFQSATDKAHLNEKGHDRFLPVAESFILQY